MQRKFPLRKKKKKDVEKREWKRRKLVKNKQTDRRDNKIVMQVKKIKLKKRE